MCGPLNPIIYPGPVEPAGLFRRRMAREDAKDVFAKKAPVHRMPIVEKPEAPPCA